MRLVFGASGFVGTNLLAYLHERGHPVRAAARRPAALLARGWPPRMLVAADALRPETLPAVLAGVDVAYYLVHSMAAGRRFGRLDEEAAVHFRDAAAAAGVRRIVYLGGLVPPDATTEHLVSRARTGEILRRGAVPVTEIRAGIIIGPGSAAFEVMRDTTLHLPMMVVPRDAHRRTTPIALDDLLAWLAGVPDLAAAAGAIFDAGGPETLTYVDMMERIAAGADRRPPRLVTVPLVPPGLFSPFLGWVSSVPTPIARALFEGMRHDFATDDERLARLLPRDRLDVTRAIEAVFAAERALPARGQWFEGAPEMRDYRPDYAFYAKRASASHRTRASPAAVWAVLCHIGGDNRYFYQDWLWTLRELLDHLAGGPGRRHGRSDPERLRPGDHVDSWEIIGVEEERRLTLKFGMRAPGSGVLEFELEPTRDGGTELTMTAYWHPAGITGLAYWFALDPFHKFLFRGTTREICRVAERRETARGS